MNVRFLIPARLEFLEAMDFYESQASGLGDDFVATVEDATRTIADSPAIGSPYGTGVRRLVLPRFPFSVVYETGQDEILVIAVAHQRRRPGYWRDR